MTSLQIKKYIKNIREYYEQLYFYKFNNLGEMDKFLPKFTQEEIKNTNSSLSIHEIEIAFKNLSIKKTPDQDGFTSEFY